MRIINTVLAIAVAMCSQAYGEVDCTTLPLTKSCHSSGSTRTFNLSLQAIQSNFVGPGDDITAGNNGLPIEDSKIPVVFTVRAKHHSDKTSLSIAPFSFTLTAAGFMISEDVLPQDVSPRSATWVDFDAGPGIVGHVFRDGSIRFSGPNNAPLAAGTYQVLASKVSYSEKIHPSQAKGFFKHNGTLVRADNFPISEGQSNLGLLDSRVNNSTDYAEYYGLAFLDGKVYTATTDNSFYLSNTTPASPSNAATPTSVFNIVDRHGNHLISQVDIVPPGFANQALPPSTDIFQLTEETLSVNPTNPQQLATTFWAFHSPEPTPLAVAWLYISNDGGQTWNFVNAFDGMTLPTPPAYPIAISASNQGCIFDKFGNLFYTTLVAVTADFSTISLVEYVVRSSDGGATWEFVDFLTGIDPSTFGLDFPVINTGAGPNGSAVTWLTIKQDVNFQEIEKYGSTLPLIAASYQTTSLGSPISQTHQEVAGSNPGGFGNAAVGPKGETLIVGMAVNNTLGTLPFGNSSLFYSFNPNGVNGLFNPAKVFINSNTGYLVPYAPQVHRNTFSHPQCAIDNNGRWYITYVDQPTPHINQPSANIYLIYSDNQGKSFSSPVRINNDVYNTTFHFLPMIAVDPITNDVAITWLDTREDELDTLTRLWGTVIRHGSLPRLH